MFFVIPVMIILVCAVLLALRWTWRPVPVSHTIVIGGCVSRCEPFLDRVMTNILEMTAHYTDFFIVLVVAPGGDDTRVLEPWRARVGDRLLLLLMEKGDLPEPKGFTRTRNLAAARNEVLCHIRRLYRRRRFEHFVMMDMDNVCAGNIRLEAFHSVMRMAAHWDAVSFNKDDYYDLWALSFDPFFLSLYHFQPPDKTRIKKEITARLAGTTTCLLPVLSAFNGFAVYRASMFLRSRYEWDIRKSMRFLSQDDLARNSRANGGAPLRMFTLHDCEHRYFHFHAHFRLGARIFVSPMILF
ncbi:hypothetical protein EBZ80_12610 [bacterium]|nr:hypothetical protein [bacterium]